MKKTKETFEPDGAGACTLIPEEAEDLWHLFNLVAKGDTVQAMTWRKVQKEGSTGSVQNESRKLSITVEVKNVEYDAAGNTIRFSGKNVEENQFVKLGAHHTISIELNNKLTIGKECWDSMFVRQLTEAVDVAKVAEVAVVLLDAGIANFHLLTSVLAKDVHRVNVDMPKKRATTTGYDKACIRFYELIYSGIKDHIDLDQVRCIVVAGPGFVKEDFLQWFHKRAVQLGDTPIMSKKSAFIMAHASCVHRQALKELLADEAVQKTITNTKAAVHVKALEDFYQMVKIDPDRAAYGPRQVKEATALGAVATLLLVDSLFRNANLNTRRQYVELSDNIRDLGCIVHVFSSQHISGEQLDKLGGIAAILRYPCAEIDEIDSDAGISDGDDSSEAGERHGFDDDIDAFL